MAQKFQAARCLRNALHRVDHQRDALPEQVEAAEAQIDDEYGQRKQGVESQKGQRCWPSLEERRWGVVETGHGWRPVLLGGEDRRQLVHLFQCQARTVGDTDQRFVGNDDGQAGFFHQ